VCKEHDYITNIEKIRDGKLMSPQLIIKEMFQQKGRRATLRQHFNDQLKQSFGSLKLTDVDKLLKLLENLNQNQPEVPRANYKIQDFKIDAELQHWIQSNKKPTLVICGPPGAGKTQFTYALANGLGLKPLTINHIEGFANLDHEHNALVMDDFNFNKIDEEQLLAIVDNESQKQIRVLYRNVNKKAGLVQVILLNREALAKIADLLEQERFLRRILVKRVSNDFIQNVQINVNVNSGAHLHIHHKNHAEPQEHTKITYAQEEQQRIKRNRDQLNAELA
jgi:adenylate kinase family enzyme